MKLRIWWIPQVPMNPFYINVPEFDSEDDITQLKYAAWMLYTLANYDRFQYDNNVKPDYSNAGGLQIWDKDLNDWCDWYNDTEIVFDKHVDVEDIDVEDIDVENIDDLIYYMHDIGEL